MNKCSLTTLQVHARTRLMCDNDVMWPMGVSIFICVYNAHMCYCNFFLSPNQPNQIIIKKQQKLKNAPLILFYLLSDTQQQAARHPSYFSTTIMRNILKSTERRWNIITQQQQKPLRKSPKSSNLHRLNGKLWRYVCHGTIMEA